MEKMVYTREEAQTVLQLSKPALYSLLNSGRLRGVRYGRKWLIPREAILEFLGAVVSTPSVGGLQ